MKFDEFNSTDVNETAPSSKCVAVTSTQSFGGSNSAKDNQERSNGLMPRRQAMSTANILNRTNTMPLMRTEASSSISLGVHSIENDRTSSPWQKKEVGLANPSEESFLHLRLNSAMRRPSLRSPATNGDVCERGRQACCSDYIRSLILPACRSVSYILNIQSWGSCTIPLLPPWSCFSRSAKISGKTAAGLNSASCTAR